MAYKFFITINRQPFSSSAKSAVPGFTLVELVIVIAILAVLSSIAVPSFQQFRSTVEKKATLLEMKNIEMEINSFYMDRGEYPDTLAQVGYGNLNDPWGNPYQYINISTAKGNGKLRKDHNLVPINTDFDLYSMGPDGKSVSPLTAKASRDDIIRANNGAFLGPVSQY
jgi:general secretion pathway protein G